MRYPRTSRAGRPSGGWNPIAGPKYHPVRVNAMRPQTLVAVAFLVLMAGGFGWLLRGGSIPDDRTGEARSAGDESPSGHDVGALGERITDLARRIGALEGEIRALRVEESARWARLRTAPGGVPLRPADRGGKGTDTARREETAVPVADDPAAVENVRDRWTGVLSESEKRLRELYPSGPDPRGDLVAWARFDDLARARAALGRAQDMAALRALAESEFRFYFKLDR